MHSIAIEARRHDLFLTIGEISKPLEATVSPFRVDMLAVRICDVPVERIEAIVDSLSPALGPCHRRPRQRLGIGNGAWSDRRACLVVAC